MNKDLKFILVMMLIGAMVAFWTYVIRSVIVEYIIPTITAIPVEYFIVTGLGALGGLVVALILIGAK